MNVEDCVAGRALDILVAEHVMGWSIYRGPYVEDWPDRVSFPCLVVHDEGGWYLWRDSQRLESELWKPSTSIADAWQVVARLESLGFEWDLHFEGTRNDDTIPHLYVAVFGGGGDPAEEARRKGVADNAPLAICQAALKAIHESHHPRA